MGHVVEAQRTGFECFRLDGELKFANMHRGNHFFDARHALPSAAGVVLEVVVLLGFVVHADRVRRGHRESLNTNRVVLDRKAGSLRRMARVEQRSGEIERHLILREFEIRDFALKLYRLAFGPGGGCQDEQDQTRGQISHCNVHS